MKLIKDSELIKIPVKDNGEPLVDLGKECPEIRIQLAEYLKKEGVTKCMVRETVAAMLKKAQSLLPKGLVITIRCGHRPIAIQKEMWKKTVAKFKAKNPDWSDEQLRTECSKYICPPDIVPPHSTGAALDLSISDSEGNLLDMGTTYGTQTEKSQTDSKEISEKAKKNRKILIDVMTAAGFINYPTEWWHWSYGDRYWAAVKKKKISIYGSK